MPVFKGRYKNDLLYFEDLHKLFKGEPLIEGSEDDPEKAQTEKMFRAMLYDRFKQRDKAKDALIHKLKRSLESVIRDSNDINDRIMELFLREGI